MSVKNEGDGRRSVALEFAVPGTPEQVWQAIATGPGISAWFIETDVAEREGGEVAFHFGPDMDSTGRVTAWDPPRRFAYEEVGWNGDAPPLATEFVVEAQGGGECRVRLVHSLFASDDAWDDQLESMEKGWGPFFAVLGLYQTHFHGLVCASRRITGHHAGTEVAALERLTRGLGLDGAAVGERRSAPADAPRLAGVVERTGRPEHRHELLLRLDEPNPGVALMGAFTWGGRVQVAISLYFYGDDAAAVLARELPRWQAWIDERFPAPASDTAAE